MTRLPGRRPWRLTIIAAVLFATAGGIAYATIPGSGNVYTACMQKRTGTIRLIDTSLPAKNKRSHCVAAEKSLTWNQVGPAGSAGAGGLPGAKGDVGAQGEQGLPGAKGDTGAAGVGSSVYHASVYSNGFPSNVGNSPEFVGATRLSTGIYNLNFSVDVSQCGRVATLGIPSDQQNSSTFFHGLKGEISTFYDLANNKLAVATFDSAGNPADINFHVVVAC